MNEFERLKMIEETKTEQAREDARSDYYFEKNLSDLIDGEIKNKGDVV